ncbi:MAG: glycosyltransferase family 39 protein [Ferruginibacter sp.]
MKEKQQAVWWLIILLAIIKFILPFCLQSPVYELQRDEFLYYQQGQHLAWGYLENPPLLSWLGSISSWFGGTETSIKCWPSLFGALTVMLTCLLAAEFGGRILAQLLAGLAAMTGAFLRIHSLFQPNSLDIFFWTLSIYFLIRFLRSHKDRHLYLFAISLALGFWSKYSVAFIIAALLPALLISSHRKIFLQKRIYGAAALMLLLILPNIYWQYANNWPLIHHMGELRETQLRYVDPKDFLIDQLLMTLPAVFVWIAGLAWSFKNKGSRFIGFAYSFVIALLILGSGKSYYALGIYPVLFAAGAVAWQQWTIKIKWLYPILIVIVLLLSWVILPMALPIWEPAKLAAFYERHNIKHKWEDQKEHPLSQDFADMIGWRELTDKTEKAYYTSVPDTARNNTMIFCDNYGEAGALKFYGEQADFKNKVISANGSFLLWIPGDLSFIHILFIGEDLPGKENKIFDHFESYMILDSVTNTLSRQYGSKIIFYRNADSLVNKLVNDALNERKKLFSR